MADEGTSEKKAEAAPKQAAPASAPEGPKLSPSEMKNLEIFGNIDGRYKTDPKFKEVFDKAWAGKWDEITPHVEKKVADAEEKEIDPVSALHNKIQTIEKRNEELEKKLHGIANTYGYDKVTEIRTGINQKYEEEFAGLAEKEGYKYGSDAYDALFRNAIYEGNQLARKYGLVDEHGIADPLVKFTPELVRESFEKAHTKFKSMGYDIGEKNRQEALKRKEEERKAADDKYNSYFDPKKLKTQADRSKQLKAAFNQRMRDLGVNPDSFKMV